MRARNIKLREKMAELLSEVAEDKGLAPDFFVQKMLLRMAKEGLAGLSTEHIQERVALIDEAEAELLDTIKSISPRLVPPLNHTEYRRIWETHYRLKKRGYSDLQIHDYCMDRYGTDIDGIETPSKSPKSNPNWKGGARWQKN